MPLVFSVADHLHLCPYKSPSKYLELFWSYGIHTEICEKINIKKYLFQKNAFFGHFSPKNGNQLKRTWHPMKAETLEKPCVKFEECRLNTLRENQICQNVNRNVNQESAARPPPGHR